MTERAATSGGSVFDLYGVGVRSEIDLGLEVGLPGAAKPPDVEVRVGECRPIPVSVPSGSVVAERFDGPGQRFYTATAGESGYCLRFHGRFDFLVSADRRCVRVDWAPEVQLPLAAVYFTGTVMAFLFGLAGRLALHASAVAVTGGPGPADVFAILGASGAGKTTLAALCSASGAAFVTDDLLLVDLDSPAPRVGGAGNELRLRPEADWVLDLFSEAPDVRRTADGRMAIRPTTLGNDPGGARFRAMVVPVLARDGEAISLSPLSHVDSLFELVRAPRLAGWTADDVVGRQFAAMADLAERVPLFTARIPWSQSARPRVGAALLRLLCDATG